MASQSRKKHLPLKLSAEQLADVKDAAKLEASRRRERLGASTLFRDCAMPEIHQILRRHGRTPKSAPAHLPPAQPAQAVA